MASLLSLSVNVRRSGIPSRERLISALNQQSEALLWPDLSLYETQARWYTRSPWTFISVNKIARSASLVNVQVFKMIQEKRVPQVNHAIERLLARPSQKVSRFSLLFGTVALLEIAGNCYWFLNGVGNPAGAPEDLALKYVKARARGLQPQEILVLRPDRMRVVPGRDSSSPVAGYVYEVDGILVPFEAHEIVHFKRFHPLSDFYGLSPLQAAQISIETDYAMGRWNRNFFSKENVVPAGVVNIKNHVDEATYERIKKEWQESYGTQGGQRRTAFLRGGDVDWQSISLSHKDVDFAGGRSFEKELIFLIHGIPPGIMDKNSTEANALASNEMFMSQTVWPIMVEITQTLDAGLAPFYAEDGELIIEPEDIRRKDGAAQRAELQVYAPYLSINEVRERYLQAEAVPWGDLPSQGNASKQGQLGTTPGFALQPSEPAIVDKMGGRPVLPSRYDQTPDEEAPIRSLPPGSLPSPSVQSVQSIHLTRAACRELERFVTFAGKRMGDLEAISRFEFRETPEPLCLAAKAWATSSDSRPELGLLADMVPVAGFGFDAKDPQLDEKKEAISAGVGLLSQIFERLLNELVAGPSLSARPSETWWASVSERIREELTPLASRWIEAMGRVSLRLFSLTSGWGVDEDAVIEVAASMAKAWASQQLASVLAGTYRALLALWERWSGERISSEEWYLALRASPLFSEKRARFLAGDFAAMWGALAAWAAGSLVTAWVGKEAGFKAGPLYRTPSLADLLGLYPVHLGERCFLVPEFVYDEQNQPQFVDYRWWNGGLPGVSKSGPCAVCLGRNGKLLSEIRAEIRGGAL